MKRGIDVSHWNNWSDIWENQTDFMFAKLTEGKSIIDWTAYQYYTYANALQIPFGVYHYAHPENNSAKEEFEQFKKYFRKFNNTKIYIALDIEAKALEQDPRALDEWAFEWMRMADAETWAPVFIYIQQSACKMFEKCTAYPLWVARHRAESKGYGNVSPWSEAAIWQYDSVLVDKNIMY